MDLEKTGVYRIKNLVNNKVYVGSTRKSFVSRYKSHYEKLRTNNHKAYPHLQSAVNKYGIENFEFAILEICNIDNCIQQEAIWIAKLRACEREIGYNINDRPSLSPFANKEIRKKAANTLSEGYKTGRIKPNRSSFKKGSIPWNKGRKWESTNHLRVPKKTRGSRENFSKSVIEKLPQIEVFSNGVLVGTYLNHHEASRDSENLQKFMVLRNKKGRQGYAAHILQTFNIARSCKTGKPYKGLIFKAKSSQ